MGKTTAKAKPTPKAAARAAKAPAAALSFVEVMAELERSGSEQTKKTYLRHGAQEPLFGVSFATLKTLKKRIGVDHALALELWKTGNVDARNLAVKVVDPLKLAPRELDAWAASPGFRMCGGYVAMLASEGAHGPAKMKKWLAAKTEVQRVAGWVLLGQVAARDEHLPDATFSELLVRIERTIHQAPNDEREVMNRAVIAIGCRNPALRKAALAAAKRIGHVDIDYGDTSCTTPDAAATIEKAWAHSTSKGHASPAAHERTRDVPRIRC